MPRAENIKAIAQSDTYLKKTESSVEEHFERLWTTDGSKTFWGTGITKPTIPAGLYSLAIDENRGPIFIRVPIISDELLLLPDSKHEQILKEINLFWKTKDKFTERGFIHKRGVILWGDPGSGKTSTVRHMINNIVNAGGIAAYATDADEAVGCLSVMRRIEPDRPIVVIMEDFETLLERRSKENTWLSLLDGECQIDNVVFVATTNYPEALDKRFVDRPSRFDMIVKIPMPSAKDRKYYLMNKEPSLTENELQEWVDKTKGMSLAHLKEVIIGVKCLGKSLDDVIGQLRDMTKRNLSSESARPTTRGKMGFSKKTADDELY